MKNKYLSFFIILLITFIAPMTGSYVTASFKEPWYSEIILPSFNPPSWVFAPVWTTLYLLMTISIWKIWINSFNKGVLKIYFIHLIFNSTWSIVFFGFHLIGLALIKSCGIKPSDSAIAKRSLTAFSTLTKPARN